MKWNTNYSDMPQNLLYKILKCVFDIRKLLTSVDAPVGFFLLFL